MEVANEARYVRVQNDNEFTIIDHYDGQPYKFPPGEMRTIPLAAAAHIFGFTPTATEEQCRIHCLKRFGFNTPEVMAKGGHELFWENLSLTPVLMRLREVEEEVDGPTAPPVEQIEARHRRGTRKGKRYKRVLTPKAAEPDTEAPLPAA